MLLRMGQRARRHGDRPSGRRGHGDLAAPIVGVGEVQVGDAVDHLGVELEREVLERADRDEDLAHRGREVGPQVAVTELAARPSEVLGGPGGQPDAVGVADPAQDLVEGVVGDRRDQHLRLDATEERLVAQRLGLEVGREHDLGVEGDVELHAVIEHEVVALAVEGHDPAVEQGLGRQVRLAAEVVDHQDPVVGLHLHRGHVGAAVALVLQVEHLRAELAADDEARAVAQHPAPVDARSAARSAGLCTTGSKTLMIWLSTSTA